MARSKYPVIKKYTYYDCSYHEWRWDRWVWVGKTCHEPVYYYRDVPVYGYRQYPIYGFRTAYYVSRGGELDAETQRFRSQSYHSYPGIEGAETRPILGDVDGDGLSEVIVGGGPGRRGTVDVHEGDGTHLATVTIPWPEYNAANGETWPAVGDVDSDGEAEIVVGLGEGGLGLVYIFGGASKSYRLLHELNVSGIGEYLPAALETYEIRPSVGDLDGDGEAEIVITAGPGESRFVFIFGGASRDYASMNVRPLGGPGGSGAWTAIGDLDHDGKAEIVATSAGRGYILTHQIGTYFRPVGYSPPCNGRPAIGDIDGDGAAEILCGHEDSRTSIAVWSVIKRPNGIFTTELDRWHPTWLERPLPAVGNINP